MFWALHLAEDLRLARNLIRRARAAWARCSREAPAGCSRAGIRCCTPLLTPSSPVWSGRTVSASGFHRSGGQEAGSVSPCGVVKWFDPDRGVGLISQEGAGPDVRAEASAVHGKAHPLRQGDKVLFNITLDSAGPRADNIHRPERAQDYGDPERHTGYRRPPETYCWAPRPRPGSSCSPETKPGRS
ncbi:cold-shock protein [Streptomyces sp. H27-S2]|uniref:cold-shock protein n=1 Tax=Streptomyces antarcticus TaxID=2996458 RepID=UPI003B63B8B6